MVESSEECDEFLCMETRVSHIAQETQQRTISFEEALRIACQEEFL